MRSSVSSSPVRKRSATPSGSSSSHPRRSSRIRARSRAVCFEIHLVLRELGVDLAYGDAVVLERPLDRDIAVDDVFLDRLRIALERIAEAAAAGRGAGERVARPYRDVREHGSEEALGLRALVQPDAVWDRRETAFDPPGDRSSPVAADRT